MIGAKQKWAVDYVIAKNPTEVTVTRTAYVEKDGARDKVVVTTDPQVWLVFPKSARTSEKRKTGGTGDVSDWGALAPSTADVQWGEGIVDEFTIAGTGTFEVKSGRVLQIGPTVNGYELDLKLVK